MALLNDETGGIVVEEIDSTEVRVLLEVSLDCIKLTDRDKLVCAVDRGFDVEDWADETELGEEGIADEKALVDGTSIVLA